ncbi:glutamate receptor-like [Anopheles ziemanni]|uniref:glutamate receptor-like n=1 Tax=Anopheles coustani TaxID=139045 RepID=UPI002657C9E7|nr:glutamate receptor-like [Anopheles coustani]XP_058170449.1 glutamate receptor-like [Anopheles ziemanni]
MDSLLSSLEFTSALQLLLNTFLVTHLSEHHSVCVIRGHQDDIRLNFSRPTVNLLVDASSSLDTFSYHLVQAIDVGCEGFVLTESTLFPFLDTFRSAHEAASFRASNKRIIAVTPLEPTERHRLINHETMGVIYNILFLVTNATERTIELYSTEIFFAEPKATLVELVRLDSFIIEESFSPPNVSGYSPVKSTNLRGQRLRLSTLPYPPFSVVKEVPLGTGNARSVRPSNYSYQADGTELLMFLEFCYRYNCTLEIEVFPEGAWGSVYPNGSTDGLVGSIIDRQADVTVAAVYRWYNWYNHVWHSAYTGRSKVSLFVPRPRLLPHWQTPFLAFPLSLWFMVCVSFCAGTTAVFITERFRQRIRHPDGSRQRYRLLDAIFFMVSLYVEQSAPLHNDLIAGTILLSFLLFGGFMVGNSYAGALSSVMTVPRYEKSIDTRADFLAAGMKFIGSTPVWIYTLSLSVQPEIVKLRNSYEVYDIQTISKFVHTRHDLGYIHERMQYGSFCLESFIDLYGSRHLQPLKQEVFWEISITACSKTWPMIALYDDLVLRVQQTGIFRYWEQGSTFRTMGQEIQRNLADARVHDFDNDPVKLEMAHFLGVFFILFVGQILATIIFIVELLVYRRQRNRENKLLKLTK